MDNTYSSTWFELFEATIDALQTQREVEFLSRQLPLPMFRRTLDVCCGTGRHAAGLCEKGFELHQGTREHQKLGRRIRETKSMHGESLRVELEYDNRASADTFEWQLFSPEQIITVASEWNLHVLLACTDFDESQPPSADRPRMQFVFEKL